MIPTYNMTCRCNSLTSRFGPPHARASETNRRSKSLKWLSHKSVRRPTSPPTAPSPRSSDRRIPSPADCSAGHGRCLARTTRCRRGRSSGTARCSRGGRLVPHKPRRIVAQPGDDESRRANVCRQQTRPLLGEFGQSTHAPVQLVGADRCPFADLCRLHVNRKLPDQLGGQTSGSVTAGKPG